jgi:predicted AAA+ superfamily ATPase
MYVRLAERRVTDALADTPVVVVQGPRQCGKTTLVKRLIGEGATYVTLDDSLALDAALRNPAAFVAQFQDRAVIDEVQRAPGLFVEIKKSVDEHRAPGRFLLTGSSNVMLSPRLTESLAGRVETVPLWPLTQSEIGSSRGEFLETLFEGRFQKYVGAWTWSRATQGGFPEPVARPSHERAHAWFDSYVKTVTERDVRDLADIEGLAVMPRLLRVLARHCGESLNVSRLSRETGLPHTTLTRYLALLEAVFILRPLPAWTDSSGSAKSSKLMFADPGVLCHLLGVDAKKLPSDEVHARKVVECFVACEVMRLNDALPARFWIGHFRSLRTWSVPLVVAASDGRIVGIDVCTAPVPAPADFRGLEFLRDVAGDAFVQGILLCVSGVEAGYTEKLSAVRVSALWA